MIKKEISIPLYNFTLGGLDSLEVGNGKIRVAREEEKFIAIPPHLGWDYSYLYHVEVDIDENNDRSIMRAVDRIAILFKLYKDSQIFLGWWFEKGQRYQIPHYLPWIRRLKTLYTISANEQDSINRFWEERKMIELDNFAVNRYHLADMRPYLKDSFVDYIMALEFLLVPDTRSEISFKFRTAGAFIFHEINGAIQEEMFNYLKNAYNVRSLIVHGESSRDILKELGKLSREVDDDFKWYDALNKLSSLVRQAINYFFDKNLLNASSAGDRRKYIEKIILRSQESS